jgi:hypothetical protein
MKDREEELVKFYKMNNIKNEEGQVIPPYTVK